MSGAFSVDRQELADTVEQLIRFEQRLSAAVDDADREVVRLHASWSGAAAEEHRHAHEQWRRATADMAAALSVMRQVAHGAHGNYNAAASANTSMWAL